MLFILYSLGLLQALINLYTCNMLVLLNDIIDHISYLDKGHLFTYHCDHNRYTEDNISTGFIQVSFQWLSSTIFFLKDHFNFIGSDFNT